MSNPLRDELIHVGCSLCGGHVARITLESFNAVCGYFICKSCWHNIGGEARRKPELLVESRQGKQRILREAIAWAFGASIGSGAQASPREITIWYLEHDEDQTENLLERYHDANE